MITAFQIFLFIAAVLSLLCSFGNDNPAAERAFKVFCAVGAMIFCTLLIAVIAK